ncbi:MAG: slipin family protein [gamma proteobacterium symbiont of Bathyaustriella thionipta]|nr:slipin family protein [gamma proteobacterium symbiont of Bathyaustriella thionipta]
MLVYQRVVVAEHERALVSKEGSIQCILEPGVYRFFDPLKRITIRIFDLGNEEFCYSNFDVLAERHADLCERYFHVFDLHSNQVGLVYRKHLLVDILEPGSHKVYWRSANDIKLELIDIEQNFQLDSQLIRLLARLRNVALARKLANFVYLTEVADHFVGLLIIDGKLVETLASGVYMYWKFNRSLKIEQVDSRVQSLEVGGQEILTSDKVTLRVNLSAAFQVKDAVKARTQFKDWHDSLYRELQFALRQAIATRTLDSLLGDKGALDRDVFLVTADKLADSGIELRSVGVKDIILPGDMKDILNQVVAAEKASQANVIKRREETAATRALLNTAKLMDQNKVDP